MRNPLMGIGGRRETLTPRGAQIARVIRLPKPLDCEDGISDGSSSVRRREASAPTDICPTVAEIRSDSPTSAEMSGRFNEIARDEREANRDERVSGLRSAEGRRNM